MWKRGDGYYEIHYTCLSTRMLEIFPNKGILKNYRWRREWAGEKKRVSRTGWEGGFEVQREGGGLPKSDTWRGLEGWLPVPGLMRSALPVD